MTGGLSEWRLIDADDEQHDEAGSSAPESGPERLPRHVLIGLGAAALLVVAATIWATLPAGGVVIDGATGQSLDARAATGSNVADAAPGDDNSTVLAPVTAKVVVDIEGAVVSPGVHELPEGSRIGDAIAAAGGYSASVDIAAAGIRLNLAQPLTDGIQIRVPSLGEQTPVTHPADAATAGESTGGLIDVNTATADQLDTLPGIGPVTAAKIIDARTDAPFATIDELQSRGVVGPSTFDKIRDLVTVTP